MFILHVEDVLPGVWDISSLYPQGGEVTVLPAPSFLCKDTESLVFRASVQDDSATLISLRELPRELWTWVCTKLQPHHGVGASDNGQFTCLAPHPGRPGDVQDDMLAVDDVLLPPDSVGGATLVPALVLVLQAGEDQHPAFAPPDCPLFGVLKPGIRGGWVSRGLAGQGDLGTQ